METRGFDLDYRLMGLTGTGSTPVAIQKLNYMYDAADNVSSITDAVTAANSQSFGYDMLNRLTSAAGGYGSLGYGYDANGNLKMQSPAPALSAVTGFTYNQAGRLASTASSSGTLTQYAYDGFGQRLMKVGSLTAMTLFQYDSAGHLLEEADNLGNVKADYIYLDGRPVAENDKVLERCISCTMITLGTPQVATDKTQTAAWIGNYLPFGALNAAASVTGAVGQDLRLPGQENDAETGLYHNGFRDFSEPSLGRYLESDPIGLVGGLNSYG